MFLLTPWLSAACKDSEDLSDVTDFLDVTADFVASESCPTGTTDIVSLETGSVGNENIILDVVVTDVSKPVSGISVKLTYPDQFTKFVACSSGDMFQSGTCFFAEPAPGSGEVLVGRSLIAPEVPVAVSGSRTIVRLQFLVFGVDQAAIVFEAQNLGGGDATALLDDKGDPILVEWCSGDLVGR